jgi:hypothetical protein
MKLRDSLLVALPAVLAGLGGGFLFASMLADRGAEASGRGSSAAPSNAALASAPSARKDVLAAAPTSSERGVAAASPEVAPAVSERELARALDKVQAPAISTARGGGAIFGTVLGEDGAPLAGVTVIGTDQAPLKGSDPADVGKAAPEDTSLDEHLRAAADSWARSRARLRRAVTGADGGYELANLPEDGSYRLSAYRAGFVFETEGSAYSIAPGSRVDFTAAAVFAIPVELVHADGTRPAEGVVRVTRGNATDSYAWTPAAPELRARSGRIGVRGFANVHAGTRYGRDFGSDLASEEVALDVAERAGVPLVLALAPRSGIRGRVVDGQSGSSDRPMVRIMPVAAGVDLEALAQAEQTRPQNDRFAFYDLAPGTYAVGLGSWGEPILVHEVVTVGAGIVDVDLVVPEPDPERTLLVRAFGPEGRALRDLDFGWRYERSSSSSSGGIQARRRPDGAWVLRPKPEFYAPWTPETKFTLSVTHAQFGAREVALAEGQREVDVAFEEPVAIVLVLANYVGSGYEGRLSASVAKTAEGRSSRRFAYSSLGGDGKIGADGVARFEQLAPGDWTISLSVRAGQWQTRPIGTRKVSLVSGEKTVRMDIPALFELAVVAPDLAAGARIQLQPAGEDRSAFGYGIGASEELDADKRVVFRGLVAGAYKLSGSGMSEAMEVTVPCGEVVLDARELNCFRVAIGDLNGVLYKSGLRAGDMVVGADGKRFETLAQAHDLYQGGGTIALIVSRGGAELNVSVPGGLLMSGADLGGMLTPTAYP